ncbi:MAG: nlpD [Herminiimonas sp.]|nr:nlpD [Herminiimonas sp.]
MNKIRLVSLAVLAATVAACTTTRNAAPIVERGPGQRNAEVSRSKAPEGRGYYTVKRGDTLFRIAQEVGQSMRDLIAWNNLVSPNDLKVDQVLRVLPPDAAAAAAPAPGGAQTGSVAASSGVEIRPLNAPGTAAAVPAPAAGASAAGVHKTGPRGDKRPYSEAALDEMQKGDAPVARAEPARPADKAAPEAAGNAAAAAAAAAANNGAGVDDGLVWMWPAEGKVVGTFDGGKKGIDIAGKMGQPILAAGSGTVLYASSVRGYGNLVIVKHNNNLLSAYAHNKTILVKEGQSVRKGQKIAEMGNSDTDSVKLHFEIRQQGKPVDPSKFLPSR